jgi:hypothetical protein
MDTPIHNLMGMPTDRLLEGDHNLQPPAMALLEDRSLHGNEQTHPHQAQPGPVQTQIQQIAEQKVLGRKLERRQNEKRKNARLRKPRRKEKKTSRNV